MEMDRPPAYKCTWVEDGKQEIYLEWPYIVVHKSCLTPDRPIHLTTCYYSGYTISGSYVYSNRQTL